MKKVIAVLILIAAVGGAYAADNGKAAKKNKTAAAQKTATAQVLTIPKDAVQRPDGTYGYTDKRARSGSTPTRRSGFRGLRILAPPRRPRVRIWRRRRSIKARLSGSNGPVRLER